MHMYRITEKNIKEFENYLCEEEKSVHTVEKYVRDIKGFQAWLAGKALTKEAVLSYKETLRESYVPTTVNSVLSSLNVYFSFMGIPELKVKAIKIQHRIFSARERELTKTEYERLVVAAKQKGDTRLYYLLQTIAATGIRVSELSYITKEAVMCGYVVIQNKGKLRQILLPKKLCRMLKDYMKKQNIQSGAVFVTKSGKPMDRSNIWSAMKRLCRDADVSKEKVFPHNLRHLFARTFYTLHKDIVRLADILGHTNVQTTRIYTMENGDVHRRRLEKLGLLQC